MFELDSDGRIKQWRDAYDLKSVTDHIETAGLYARRSLSCGYRQEHRLGHVGESSPRRTGAALAILTYPRGELGEISDQPVDDGAVGTEFEPCRHELHHLKAAGPQLRTDVAG